MDKFHFTLVVSKLIISTLIKNRVCRGIFTADVLVKGLNRGAIATRKLEGVKAGQRTRGFILVRPLTVKGKA